MQQSFGFPAQARRFAAFALLALLALGITAPVQAESSVADILSAVVRVHSETDKNASTAGFLGTKRDGYGAVIDSNGLVLTIGYLVLEATSITVTGPDNKPVPAKVIAYDRDTGFGLLRTVRPIPVQPIRFGDSNELTVGTNAVVASFGGEENAIPVRIVSRRDFAGFWEYLMPNAIFTEPPSHRFSGAVLLDRDGRLVGIGSLLIGNAAGPEKDSPGNMFLPINALKPILGQLLANGHTDSPPHPWLGVYTEELRHRVFVTRLVPGGPGDKAGIARNDIVVSVAGKPVSGQADFYRKVWALGGPGVAVPLTVLRQAGNLDTVTIQSSDPSSWLRLGTSR